MPTMPMTPAWETPTIAPPAVEVPLAADSVVDPLSPLVRVGPWPVSLTERELVPEAVSELVGG